MAISTIDIERKRGDTKRIIFRLKDDAGAIIDITTWTSFFLTVDISPAPETDADKVLQITGVMVGAGTDGRVGFTPTGTTPDGVYFYDAQGIDDNSEKITFAEGGYTLTQDITKD